jgi:hypothetical protein
MCSIEIHFFKPRLFWDFQKWTKIMSKFENLKYFMEKIQFYDHN